MFPVPSAGRSYSLGLCTIGVGIASGKGGIVTALPEMYPNSAFISYTRQLPALSGFLFVKISVPSGREQDHISAWLIEGNARATTRAVRDTSRFITSP